MKRALLLPLSLGLCTSAWAADAPSPPPSVPAQWPTGDAYPQASDTAPAVVGWRDIFRDARLQALIGQALENNRDLRVAAANIAAARARRTIQRAEQFPQIDASADATHSDSNATGRSDQFGASLGVTSFEVDLFGRLASLSKAAQQRYLGTQAAARATRLALVADIATAWLTYAADASLLAIAQETAASADKSVALTGARLQGGVVPRSDLRQAELILATAQADIARQKTLMAQDVNRLQLLVGAPIDPALLPASIEAVGDGVGELPAGLDSSILLRRPDVVQAETELRASEAEVKAARAALFPRISLTGALGYASTALSSLFTGNAFAWLGGGTASYSPFKAGAGKAGLKLGKAQRAAALAKYEKAIQTAFREVADALARRGTIDDQLTATARQTDAAADTASLTDARYKGGVTSYLGVLDAQRSLYSAQRTLVSTRLARSSNLVDLYRTLGGDPAFEGDGLGAQTTTAVPVADTISIDPLAPSTS